MKIAIKDTKKLLSLSSKSSIKLKKWEHSSSNDDIFNASITDLKNFNNNNCEYYEIRLTKTKVGAVIIKGNIPNSNSIIITKVQFLRTTEYGGLKLEKNNKYMTPLNHLCTGILKWLNQNPVEKTKTRSERKLRETIFQNVLGRAIIKEAGVGRINSLANDEDDFTKIHLTCSLIKIYPTKIIITSDYYKNYFNININIQNPQFNPDIYIDKIVQLDKKISQLLKEWDDTYIEYKDYLANLGENND
jgi:hypothetical protein